MSASSSAVSSRAGSAIDDAVWSSGESPAASSNESDVDSVEAALSAVSAPPADSSVSTALLQAVATSRRPRTTGQNRGPISRDGL